MERLVETVTNIFWRDCFSVQQLPEQSLVASCELTIEDFARMSGKERTSIFLTHGVKPALLPLFFRALQHLTSLHPTGALQEDDKPTCFPPLSANHWAPTGTLYPLSGHAVLLNDTPMPSQENRFVDPVPKSLPSPTSQRQSGFIGLRNQGSTCYLNSLLQVLYHLASFRLSIYQVEPEKQGTVAMALQKLFYSLECLDSAAETTELTTSFGWSSSDSFVQHDIHELTRILLDNLEEKFKTTQQTNVIKELFCGVMESYVICKEVNFTNAHDVPYYDVPLVVKGCQSIYDSLDKHFQPDVLDGNNQYCLEVDGNKSYHDAEMGVRFKELPPVLLFHLTRFDFDFEKGEMCKVLTRWDYYDSLDLKKYAPKNLDKSETQYSLHGVVVHMGTDARFGHYYCFVKRNNKWYKFNDEQVTEASSKEVFGDNFGGTKTNYWGSKIPLATNAYMLVYVRSSLLDKIVRRLEPTEIPSHLTERMEAEYQESQRIAKERAEDHMYLKAHLVTTDDIKENPSLLTSSRPPQNGSKHSVRLLRTAEGSELKAQAKALLGLDNVLLFVGEYSAQNQWVLQRFVEDNEQIGSLCSFLDHTASKHLTVLVMPQPSTGDSFIITHHKLFDPLEMKCCYVGSLVHESNVAKHIRNIEAEVYPLLNAGTDEKELDVVCESKKGEFTAAVSVSNGLSYVWQRPLSKDEEELCLYKNISEFQHFLDRKITVKLRKLQPPKFPQFLETELADDMTYDQVQRFVARKLELDNYDLIRFSRHNPETGAPFFMKIKKKDKSTLRTLMTSSQQLQQYLYFEVGNFTVTELENGNPLIFEFFDSHVKPKSSHTLIMPQPGEFTCEELLQRCAEVIGDDSIAGQDLRLIDVWQGRMYSIFSSNGEKLKEKFEESSEYRVERIPQPLPRVPIDRQFVVHVQHFARNSGKISTHGDPFSLYVEEDDLYEDVLERIALLLAMPVQTMVDWKPHLCCSNEILDVSREEPLAKQYRDAQQDRQNHPSNIYLGLEHAPLPTTRRQIRKDDRGLKIYN